MEMTFKQIMELITKPPIVDNRPKLETVESPIGQTAGENCAPVSGYVKRREAQRYVLNSLSRAQERANIDGFPELGQAYYDAITVLLEHWKPEASHTGADERPAPARKDERMEDSFDKIVEQHPLMGPAWRERKAEIAAAPSGHKAGDGSLDPLVSPQLRFSERMELAKQAVEWCKQRMIPPVAHNIITALDSMQLIRRTNVRMSDEPNNH